MTPQIKMQASIFGKPPRRIDFKNEILYLAGRFGMAAKI
jgi:hypothetical protein